MIEYELIRSARKTVTLQVKPDGRVVVRAPLRLAKYRIAKFVKDHETWIAVQQQKLEESRKHVHVITEEERCEGIARAKRVFPERTAYFAKKMGVTYNRITIREQKTRWGSCSSAGNLNFNWKLVLMPPELLDYVVVHELAHRREMNHSPRFWAIVEQELPDYRERQEKLKIFGRQLG
ncbi:M48 family metallopeptidase [Blautia sp. MSJ-19]|uniref:M48 family metallopeptidase n=1 Tax=Blautia sp. MSJ-19 TaxID=2841517 RepID=UPI00209C88E9|nr:SprT family zinc-dependent metalloprotease [Blautia sp. MSJ-19]